MNAYRERLFVSSRLYPDVPETLAALRSSGLIVGCITNKSEAFAMDLLEQAGIGSMFDFVFGADTFAAKKPDPEPLNQAAARFAVPAHESVMIGDSPNDSEAARRAGFRFVLARYGYVPAGAGDRLQQDMSIGSFHELPELLCAQ